MKRANIITIDNRDKYRRMILRLRPELKSMNCGLKRDEGSNIYNYYHTALAVRRSA